MQKPMSIHEIKAACIGKLVSVEAIVTHSSEIKSLAEVLTYTCDLCGQETYQVVNSASYMPEFHCQSVDCRKTKKQGNLVLQTRASKFMKLQDLVVAERSDQIPTGCVPQTLKIKCRGEVTRCAQAGDHVIITGIYLPIKRSGFMRNMAHESYLSVDSFIEAHVSNPFCIFYYKLNFMTTFIHIYRELRNTSRKTIQMLN